LKDPGAGAPNGLKIAGVTDVGGRGAANPEDVAVSWGVNGLL